MLCLEFFNLRGSFSDFTTLKDIWSLLTCESVSSLLFCDVLKSKIISEIADKVFFAIHFIVISQNNPLCVHLGARSSRSPVD